MSRTVLFAALGLLGCHTVAGQEAAQMNNGPQPVSRLITRFAVRKTSVSTTTSAAALAEATEIERRAFEQTNEVRIKNGLAALEWDADVCRMARVHSENMSRLNFFAHVTPDGLRLRDRARAVGILTYTVLGENIAYNQGYEDPGAFAVERWMASPKHRANILSNEFRAMAIGTYIAADGSVFLTQTFITR